MASAPPKKNTAFSFEVSLPSQAGSVFQVNPTLATGDVQVSIDGGSFVDIDSLPTAIDGGATLTVALIAAEMNGDRIVVRFHDVAGDEWCDVLADIFTVTQQIDDLPSAATIAAAVWATVIENSLTALEWMRLMGASLLGKLSGAATTTVSIRDTADSKNRVVATVDSDGNRTGVTLDGT